MTLDLTSLKNSLIAKQGYTISPKNRMLKDLKDLLDNMYSVRTTSPNQCSGHASTSPAGISLGDINAVATNIKPLKCSCQSQVASCTALGYSCTCNSQGSCSCNTQSCSCDSVCSCNSDNGYCSCQSDYGTCDCNTYSGGCTCDYNSNWCGCEGDGVAGCGCHGESGCGCQGQSAGCGSDYDTTYSCGCYTQSGCTALGYACTCNSRAASCPCNSLFSN